MTRETVLHLIETSDPDGAERMMFHLATGLRKDYCPEAGLIRDGWLATALERHGVPVWTLRHNQASFGRLFDFATLADLIRLIRARRVAIVHSHEFFMNVLGFLACRVTGIPLVATVHGRNYYGDRLRRRVAYRIVGRFAGQMVTVSEDLKRFLVETTGISAARIRVVPNGIAPNGAPSAQRLAALREALGLAPDSVVVGAVGRLHPVKGYAHLIDAAVPVVHSFPHVRFLIAGGGEYRTELERRARDLGVGDHVCFLGHRDDVGEVLPLFDVFVLPSLSEGMPLALLEAMAAGVPPIATDVGGVREVVANGQTGFLVSPADSRVLARRISELLRDRALAQRVGVAAREVAASRFSLTRMIQDYQDIYGQLLTKR